MNVALAERKQNGTSKKPPQSAFMMTFGTLVSGSPSTIVTYVLFMRVLYLRSQDAFLRLASLGRPRF